MPQPELPDFVAILPDRVWYLTQSGRDMWCRPPHGFFFTSSEAATAFAAAVGTELELAPIAIASKELVSDRGHRRDARPRRDPDLRRSALDPETGDVFGTILRIAPNRDRRLTTCFKR